MAARPPAELSCPPLLWLLCARREVLSLMGQTLHASIPWADTLVNTPQASMLKDHAPWDQSR